MKDERIEEAKNKIRSELAIIIYICIVLSFSVKTLVFRMGLQECIIEFLIMIFFPIYELVRMHMLKLSIHNIYRKSENKRSVIYLTIAIGLVLFFYSTTKSPDYFSKDSVVFLFIFLMLFVVMFLIARKYNQNRAWKYEREFDDDSNC